MTGLELAVAAAAGSAVMVLLGGAWAGERLVRGRSHERRALRRAVADTFARWEAPTGPWEISVSLEVDAHGWPTYVLDLAVPPSVRVVPRTEAAGLPERRTGDPVFDRRYWLDPVTLAAADLRRGLVGLPGTVRAGDGRLRLVRRVTRGRDLPEVEHAALRRLSPLLRRTLDEALLRITETEPLPHLWIAAMKALHRRDPLAAASPLRRALADPRPEVAVAAAVIAGDLARLERTEGRAARHAVAALLELGEDERVARLVGRCVRRGDAAEIEALADTLGRRPSLGGVRGLAELWRSGRIRTADARIHQALAARMAELAVAVGAHPEVEGVLLAVLEGPDAGARVEAAWALARVGSLAAVPALREAANRVPLFSGVQPFRRAIDAIQARSGGERGTLALAAETATAGGLSEADADGGLSVSASSPAPRPRGSSGAHARPPERGAAAEARGGPGPAPPAEGAEEAAARARPRP